MKTLTLLFFMPLISLIDINSQISAQNTSATDVYLTDNSSNKKNQSMPVIGKSWKYPIITKRILKTILTKIHHLSTEKANYQVKLNDLSTHLTERQKDKIANEVADIESRLKELTISIADIERIGNDKAHTYDFDNFPNEGTYYVIKGKDNEIIIQGTIEANFIHEFRHLSLSLQSKKGLRFSRNNLLMPVNEDGIVDELQAYRAQYAFAPYSLPGIYPKKFEQVNLAYLGTIKLDDGSIAYPTIQNAFEENVKSAKSKLKTNQKDSSKTTIAINKKNKKKNMIIGQNTKE